MAKRVVQWYDPGEMTAGVPVRGAPARLLVRPTLPYITRNGKYPDQ